MSESKTLRLDIASAEQEIFSGNAKMVFLTGEMGELGIAPGHTPLITKLKAGNIRILLPSEAEEIYYVNSGMLEVQPYVVTVLADTVVRAKDIDEAAAIQAKEHAEKALHDRASEIDIARATTELAEAIALKLSQMSGAKPFLVIARFDRKYIDANRPSIEAYEALEAQPYYGAFHSGVDEACKQIRQVWGRGLLLDIHGQAAEANVIFRGTRHGKSVTDLVRRFGRQALTGSQSILGQLALSGYNILPDPYINDRESRYIGGHTVQTYGSYRATGIDAMQLEFGTRLRARDNVDRTAADVAAAITVFAKEYLPITSNSIEPTIGTQP